MRIGVCGIACEKGPRLERGPCPNGAEGCRPKENKFCAVAFGYCTYIAGKA